MTKTKIPLNEKLTLTIEEAAQFTGIGETTINKLMSEGKIPYAKIGRKKLIQREDIEIFIESVKNQINDIKRHNQK
jgi:excisionase family DNA binding protein